MDGVWKETGMERTEVQVDCDEKTAKAQNL